MVLSAKRLQVHHYPQIPCDYFCVNVKDEYEAIKIITILAAQHIWLFTNKIIPDYNNIMEVIMWNGREWIPYYNEEECMDWNDFATTYENELTF